MGVLSKLFPKPHSKKCPVCKAGRQHTGPVPNNVTPITKAKDRK